MAGELDLAHFFPGYFALVMATGIVSLAAHLQGRTWVALGLFALNLVAYAALWIITLVRLACYPRALVADLTGHARSAAFLTTAAATCVLGSQFALLTRWGSVAEGLWFIGAALGLVLNYTFFTAMTVREPKPSLAAGISGAWLLVVVATESISVLGSLVARSLAAPEVALFVSLAVYVAGAIVYVFLTTLIVYRWMFFSMRPESFTPDYWVNMGALAITTLAGALLVRRSGSWSFLGKLGPFLTGSMLLFWAAATWWIPLLVTLELWRHLRGRPRLRYAPDYWAMVFPLGMYAVATSMMVRATGLIFLNALAEFFAYVALAAWAVVFAGLLHRLAGSVRYPWSTPG